MFTTPAFIFTSVTSAAKTGAEKLHLCNLELSALLKVSLMKTNALREVVFVTSGGPPAGH